MEGIEKNLIVQSCSLQKDALLSLFDILNEKAVDAAGHNVNGFEQLDDESDAEFAASKLAAQSLMRLSVLIKLNNGHWQRVFLRNDFESYIDTHGPAINFIQYESAFKFRNRINKPPVNQFYIDLDLKKQSVFSILERASDTINQSTGVITGDNSNWVNGTYKTLEDFFKLYSTPYSFIHKKTSYDLMLWLFGVPLTLAWLYKISQWIGDKLDATPEVISIAIYLYLFYLMLMISRILFNYTRYIFLKVEGPRHPNKGPWRHRALLAALVLTFIGGLFK
ncbi:MAG: hypothetical protein RPU51_18090 [Candidatus Sedimenticola sp. (ex Thyasira tokunagai)]